MVLVAAVALATALWGAGTRDLSGDELHMLRGGPLAAVAGAYGPLFSAERPFWGHLPLSYGLRELVLATVGTEWRLAWRLHSVAAAVGASTLVAAAGLRFGRTAALVGGLLLAVDPILAFHAQDAGNYAMSALCGALVLSGLLGARTGGAGWSPLLGAGLVLGCLNDLWFGLVVGIAAVASVPLIRAPATRRAVLKAWLPAVVLPGPLALALAVVGSVGRDVVLHADPAAGGPGAAAWAVVRRFFGAHLGGYEAGRIADFWDAGPAVLLGLGLLVLAGTRRLRHRPGATLPVVATWGALLSLAVAAAVFGLATGRQLPVEPRSTLGLAPFFALAVGIAAQSRPALAAVLALAGLATLEQRLDRPRAQEALRAEAAHQDWVMRPPWGTPGLAVPGGSRSCLDALPGAGTLVVVSEHADCRPEPCTEHGPTLRGWHRARVRSWDPPASERNAASFLPTWTACEWQRDGEPPTGAAAPLQIHIVRSLGDGIPGGVTVVPGERGALRAAGASSLQLDHARPTVTVRVEPRAPAWMPQGALFAPFRRSIQSWGPLPVGTDGRIQLRSRSLQSPWLRVALRVSPLLILIACLFRRRP